MQVNIYKTQVPFTDIVDGEEKILNTNALVIIPSDRSTMVDAIGVFTHGYTSHKASILNWPLRLAEDGIPCILFDLPGHFLGTFSEVQSFDAFKKNAPLMFGSALDALKCTLAGEGIDFDLWPKSKKLIVGGHSLGALLSMLSLSTDRIQEYETRQCIAVGFGLPPQGVTHIFDTPFYRSTLNVRGQLVSPALNPGDMFPWIKEEKEKLDLMGESIYLLTGEDDVVVGKDGTERLAQQLEDLGNRVIIEKPKKLGHHLPENAAPHIRKYLRDLGFFN